MQLSNIPGKLVLPFANAGGKSTIPVESQIGITAGAASLTDGFPPLTRTPIAAGGVPPSGLDMNGILYEMSAIIRWANAGGGYPFDGTFATDPNVGGYPTGARIMRTDGTGYWFNTVENNVTDPESAGAAAAGWVPDFTTGIATVAMASSNVTLMPVQYGKPLIVITGTLTANLNLIFPTLVQTWTIVNATTGGYGINCTTVSGLGVVVAGGRVVSIYGDGSNIKLANYNNIGGQNEPVGNMVSRNGERVFAFGRNSDNAGAAYQGLQIGGGDIAYGPDGMIMAPDGHASWLRIQPSKNESPAEFLIYATSAQGRATASIGTNQVALVSGSPFSTTWVGKKFYLGGTVYKVGSFVDASHITVTTVGGGAVSFASTFTETFHVCYISGQGVCNVNGSTVTRVSGDPFISFIAAPFTLKINGVLRTVSSFIDTGTYTLASAPGNLTNATYVFETDINDQISTLRVQKVIGNDEENLSIYARYDGYWIHSLFAGNGQYRPVIFGSGEVSAGVLAKQIVCQPNGDVTFGGTYDVNESIRVLNAPGAVNRFETQGAVAGISPSWRARGADANVGMTFDTKGAGSVSFSSHSLGNNEFQIFGVGGSSWLAVGSSSTSAPTLSANGADANIDIKLQTKGSGVVWLNNWLSNGDAAINGYVYVKDATGTLRKLATIA